MNENNIFILNADNELEINAQLQDKMVWFNTSCKFVGCVSET